MKSFFTSLWARITGSARAVWSYAIGHKIIAGIAAIIILGGGYWAYANARANATTAEYVLTRVVTAPIQSTVSASGEVAADHQLDLSPKASGEVTGVYIKAGDNVKAGQLLVSVDATDAEKSVRDAQLSLQSAQISYTQAITSAQNDTSNSATSVTSARDSGFDAVTSAQNNLSTVTNGLHDLLYDGTDMEKYLGDPTVNAYTRLISDSEPTAETAADTAKASYEAAEASYNQTFAAYQAASRTSSPQDIQALIKQTQDTATKVTQAVKDTRAFFELVNLTVANHRLLTVPPSLSTQISSLNTYTSTSNSTASSLVSAQNSITSALQNYSSNTQSITGGTPLAVQSAQLNLAKSRQSLADAQEALADYAVRAPFDGTIAEVDVQKFDQASGKVATLITTEQYATISLNEADISNIRTGESANLTFDAVDDLTIQGTVAQVNQIGTVSQGVTTYTVKIGFDTQDPRIKPGMTVNAEIVTASNQAAIVVPSSAVKTANGESYVEVATAGASTGGRTASTTNRISSSSNPARTASSSTSFANRPQTVAADSVTITRVPVTTGIESDTMVEITSGLSVGQNVVSESLNASGKATTQAKGLSSLFGGGARPAGAAGAARTTTGTVRTGGGAAGAARAGGTFGGGAARGG